MYNVLYHSVTYRPSVLWNVCYKSEHKETYTLELKSYQDDDSSSSQYEWQMQDISQNNKTYFEDTAYMNRNSECMHFHPSHHNSHPLM